MILICKFNFQHWNPLFIPNVILRFLFEAYSEFIFTFGIQRYGYYDSNILRGTKEQAGLGWVKECG